MGKNRLTLFLDDELAQALRQSAKSNYRTPALQAELIIREKLKNNGVVKSDHPACSKHQVKDESDD